MLSRAFRKGGGYGVRYFSQSSTPNVAVVLHGCGVYDGTEITEAVSVLISLGSRANVQCFAPDQNQMHVIDHTKGEEMNETRNVLLESSRITRGNVKPLTELKADDYAAVVWPGGFGAAKNLCDFAVKGPEMTVNPEVERVIKEFHEVGKPQGFCCIAPVLAAKVLGAEVTVGSGEEGNPDWPYAGTAGAIDAMGGKHVEKTFDLAHTDVVNKVVTSPAYMYNGQPHQIFASVNVMIDGVMKLLKKL